MPDSIGNALGCFDQMEHLSLGQAQPDDPLCRRSGRGFELRESERASVEFERALEIPDFDCEVVKAFKTRGVHVSEFTGTPEYRKPAGGAFVEPDSILCPLVRMESSAAEKGVVH